MLIDVFTVTVQTNYGALPPEYVLSTLARFPFIHRKYGICKDVMLSTKLRLFTYAKFPSNVPCVSCARVVR